MSYDIPNMSGVVITETIVNPAVAADTDIDFTTYMPKIDMSHPSPIIRMMLMDTTDGSTTAWTEYTINDRGVAGSLGAGEFDIVDEDTIVIGDATDTALHTFRLEICYIANLNRIKNT